MNNNTNQTTNNATIQSHKSKHDNYYIVYRTGKMKTDKTITTINNCADIKKFIKKIRTEKITKLNIYKSDKTTKCRLSAWVN